MGWFQRLIGIETKSYSEVDVTALLDAGARTAADIAVSPATAERHPPVRLGVAVRCETISILGLHVFNREDKSRADDHPLYSLLHDRVNDWTSSTSFIQEMERDCVLHGRAFAQVNRSSTDTIGEIIKLDFHSVMPDLDDSLEPIYHVTLKNGTRRTYGWRDILDVPTLGNLSAIKQCREAIGLAMALERHAAKLMANGARPSGVYKNKKKLGDVAYERLKRSVNSHFSGESAGGVVILEEDSDFSPLTFNSVDMQFQEMRAFQLVEIARALGTPPNLIFDFSRATWGNASEATQSFLTFTLMPRTKLWQGALMRLLSLDEQAKYYIEFDTNSLVQADIAARYEAYAKAIAARILNPNEARAKENLPPYEGGDEFINPNIQEAGGEKPPEPVVRAKPVLVA